MRTWPVAEGTKTRCLRLFAEASVANFAAQHALLLEPDGFCHQLPRPYLVVASEALPRVSEATDQALPPVVMERVFALPRVTECAANADEARNSDALQAHREYADLIAQLQEALVFPPAYEILLGLMVAAVGPVDGPWSGVPRLWMPEFGWALERAFPVLGQVIDARAPLVNAYLGAIVGVANAQSRAPLEVLAQHLRSGSGLFLDCEVARNAADFALPLEFALEILQAASLPLRRPLVVPPNRIELPPFCTPEMTDEALAERPVQAAFDAAVQAVRDAELQDEE